MWPVRAGAHFEELIASGLNMVELPIARSMNVLRHRESYLRLVDYLRKNRYDVVHVHTPVASFIARAAATKAKVPVRFYTAHGFYFHENMPGLKRRAHVALERGYAKRCDHIFTVSNEDRETAIREKIAPAEMLTYIGQGVDVGKFDPGKFSDDELQAARSEFGFSDEHVVVTITGRAGAGEGLF